MVVDHRVVDGSAAGPGAVDPSARGPGAADRSDVEAGALSGDGLSDVEVDRMFRALADATRRDILRRTLLGEESISQLAGDYDMSFAAVQKHVAVLERAGLVSKEARGRERLVRGDPVPIRRVQELLDSYEQLWRERIGRLDALLAEEP